MIFIDFDGILFKSDYEPLLSSLAASEIHGLSGNSLNEIKVAYLLAKPTIRNVAGLHTFINSNFHNLDTRKSLREFTDNIKKVRKSATEDRSVYQSFEPTSFFRLLLNWWAEVRPTFSVLTSRDVATASTILEHYGPFSSIPIYSSIELNLSKTMMLREYSSSPFAIVDDMMDNLIDIHRRAYSAGSLLIFGSWGYGEMVQNSSPILECSEEEAILSLRNWSSSHPK